jgi:hypothetical protein
MARLAGTSCAEDWRLMRVLVIALCRTIVRRVAVHAPRTGDHFGGFGE